MAYDIPNISVKITPFQNEDDDLKAVMQLALMQRRAAKGSGSGGGGDVKSDIYLVPDPQNPGMPRAISVPGNYAESRKNNFAVLNELNDRAVASAFLKANPDIEQAVAGLDQLDVASQKAKLDELRTTVVPKYADAHGISTEQALGIFDRALAPVAERIAERKSAVESASKWDAFTDLLALGVGNVFDRVMNPAASDEEVRANAKDYARRRQEIIENNAYLRDQEKRAAAGQGFFERSDGIFGTLANAGLAASEVLPSMAPVFAGAAAGAAAGSVAGPVGSFVGGLVGGAIPSAITSQYDYADILEARPDLTEDQKARVFSEGRTAATLLGGALGAVPGGVGQAVARGAGSVLTRAGLTSLGRQASRAGQAVTAEQLAAGVGKAEALAAGKQAASQVISEAAAKKAEDVAKRGFWSGYFHNLPLTAAEAGAMNAGFVGGVNAIQNAYGAPTDMTSGLAEAFISGAATAPFLGIFNARTRPPLRNNYSVEIEPVAEPLALPPGWDDLLTRMTGDTPPSSGPSGGTKKGFSDRGGDAVPVTPSGPTTPPPYSGGAAVAYAYDGSGARVSQFSTDKTSTKDAPVNSVRRSEPEVSPLIAEFRQTINPFSKKNWKDLEQFKGMDDAAKILAREESISLAVQDFARKGGTPEELLAHVESVKKSRTRTVDSPTSFLPKDVRDMITEFSTRLKEEPVANVKDSPVVDAPLVDAPEVTAPVAESVVVSPPVVDAPNANVNIKEVDDGAATAVTGRADVGEPDAAAETSAATPDSIVNSGVETLTPGDVAAAARLGVDLPVGDNQPVESRGTGGSRTPDIAESTTPTAVAGAERTSRRKAADGRPSAPAAAVGDAAAGVRAGKSGDAQSKRAGSTSDNTATGTRIQSTDRVIEDAAMRIFRILQEDRERARARMAAAEAQEEAAIRASEYDPALEKEALSVARAQKAAQDISNAEVTSAVKTRRKAKASNTTDEAATAAKIGVRNTPSSDGELTPPLPGKNGKVRSSVPQKVISPDGLNKQLNGLTLTKFKAVAKAVLGKKDSAPFSAKDVEGLDAAFFKNKTASQPYRDEVATKVHALLAKEWTGEAMSSAERRKLNDLRKAVPELDAALGLPKEWQDIAEQAAGIFDANAKEAAKSGIENDGRISANDVTEKLTSRLFECM